VIEAVTGESRCGRVRPSQGGLQTASAKGHGESPPTNPGGCAAQLPPSARLTVHPPRVSDAIKTSFYLRPDQVDLLDDRKAEYPRAGARWVSASDLVRAALDVAGRHHAEWHAALMKGR
jgi:hypothetical protein